ncbi:MAG: magnesium transporter CorA family protein [Eubacteriales bacterium]
MATNIFYFISSKGTIETLGSFEEALKFRGKDGYLWLSYYRPSREDLSVLETNFDINKLTIEDCLDDEQLPKVDDNKNYSHVIFNNFTYSDRFFDIDEKHLIIGDKFLITVLNHKSDTDEGFIEEFYNLFELYIKDVAKGPAFGLHILIDYLVDQKFTELERISEELLELENSILEESIDVDPNKIQKIRKDMNKVRKSIFFERESLLKIIRGDISFIPEEAIIHYRDVYDHLNKYFGMIESNREMEVNLVNINLALINNKMALASNQTNKSVRRLTLITTIFMPLTLIVGFFGMSEYTMMTEKFTWQIAYPVLVAIMTIIGFGSLSLIKWLARNDNK